MILNANLLLTKLKLQAYQNTHPQVISLSKILLILRLT